jgi:hypothetical protein
VVWCRHLCNCVIVARCRPCRPFRRERKKRIHVDEASFRQFPRFRVDSFVSTVSFRLYRFDCIVSTVSFRLYRFDCIVSTVSFRLYRFDSFVSTVSFRQFRFDSFVSTVSFGDESVSQGETFRKQKPHRIDSLLKSSWIRRSARCSMQCAAIVATITFSQTTAIL